MPFKIQPHSNHLFQLKSHRISSLKMHWQVCITASLLLAGFTCACQNKTVEALIHHFAVKVSRGLAIVQIHVTNSPTAVHKSLLEEAAASGLPSKSVSRTLLLYCTYLASHQFLTKDSLVCVKKASRNNICQLHQMLSKMSYRERHSSNSLTEIYS